MLSAVFRDDTAAVKSLVERFLVDRDKKRVEDVLAAGLASACKLGRAASAKVLIELKADPNEADSLGKTILMQAAENGHQGVVRLLLEKRADPGGEYLGLTAESMAKNAGHSRVVALLAAASAD